MASVTYVTRYRNGSCEIYKRKDLYPFWYGSLHVLRVRENYFPIKMGLCTDSEVKRLIDRIAGLSKDALNQLTKTMESYPTHIDITENLYLDDVMSLMEKIRLLTPNSGQTQIELIEEDFEKRKMNLKLEFNSQSKLVSQYFMFKQGIRDEDHPEYDVLYPDHPDHEVAMKALHTLFLWYGKEVSWYDQRENLRRPMNLDHYGRIFEPSVICGELTKAVLVLEGYLKYPSYFNRQWENEDEALADLVIDYQSQLKALQEEKLKRLSDVDSPK